jgi:nucleoside-diphosphate-sugar epimerase
VKIDANSKFFLTGGTGLVGSHILFNLSETFKVKALTRNPSRCQQIKELFEFYDTDNFQKRWANIQWVHGDLQDIPFLEEEIEGSDYVIHAAGFVSFYKRDFNTLLKVNSEGTKNLVNVCLAKNVNKLAHISSVGLLSKGPQGSLIKETNKWKNSPDNSGYSTSKYLAEREVWRGMEEGLDAVILSPSIILGPGNINESSNRIFGQSFKGSKYYIPGENAFVDVRDVADATIQLLESDIKNDIFILNATNTSYKEIFTKIAQSAGKKAPRKKISKGLINFVYNLEVILKIFGRKQKITRENIKSMFNIAKFDGSKITKAIDFNYRNIDQGIENSVNYYKKKNII